MRRASRTRPIRSYRPHLLPLEARLPLGDGALGLLVGAALLPPETATITTVAPPAGARGVSTPRLQAVTGGFTPPARPEEVFTGALADTLDAGTMEGALPTALAPTRRPRGASLMSPPREPGSDTSPSLALRAGEERAAPPLRAAAPAFGAAPSHSDAALLTTLAALYQPEVPARAADATPTQEAQIKANFGQLPLSFEQNVGQTDASVHYVTRGPGYEPATPPAVVRMQLVGANAAPAVTGRAELPGKVNYFLGNDPAQWHTNVATFGRVEYDDVYPGIDLVWYGSQRQLEYDFVVSPGVDPSVIRLNVSGAERMELDAAGDLLVHLGEPGGVSPGSTLRQQAPFVYQESNGQRQEVASHFVLEGQQVRFALGAYDLGRPLVIDPVLSYSTYLGGNGWDEGHDIAVDPATGEALLTGYTGSNNFPTANPLQAVNRGGRDVFVARLSASGSALVYSTYLGGSSGDSGHALAVDPASGEVLLTGYTGSNNFPTANPLQATRRGGSDVFVARLSASGSALVFSTYLGGSDDDYGEAIAVDPATGDALVTGWALSLNFPTANPLQAGFRGLSDVFVARLNATGSALVYSTYLGGSSDDRGFAVAVDPASGDALITGWTRSTNFPTANPLQAVYGGAYDGFVARLSAAGSALVFSTYLGGSSRDEGHALAVDPISGDALVTGLTTSPDFPTANPLQATLLGSSDVFVARLNAAGSALLYSTYLGGSSTDWGFAVVVDPATGDASLTGYTNSTNFPTANPLQPASGGGFDAFVARLNAAGSALVFSTYLGGGDIDAGAGIAVDPASGDALVTGYTVSTNFPTAHPLQPSCAGTPCHDAFVARIGSSPAAYYYVYPDSGQVQAGVPFDFYVFALDAQFRIIPDYTGLILFYATDALAVTPGYYQFERPNPGYAYFPGGLTFNTPGFQELYVFDWPGVQVFGYAAFQVV